MAFTYKPLWKLLIDKDMTKKDLMQKAGISESFINDIIGWEGKTVMLHHYSNHQLDEIKYQMDCFEYDFLKDHFAKWKEIMAKK